MTLSINDITEAFADDFYENVIDGRYEDSPIDWEEAINRYERYTDVDFGDSLTSPAIDKLKRAVRRIRAENGL